MVLKRLGWLLLLGLPPLIRLNLPALGLPLLLRLGRLRLQQPGPHLLLQLVSLLWVRIRRPVTVLLLLPRLARVLLRLALQRALVLAPMMMLVLLLPLRLLRHLLLLLARLVRQRPGRRGDWR